MFVYTKLCFANLNFGGGFGNWTKHIDEMRGGGGESVLFSPNYRSGGYKSRN